jgi:hypothetical protein
MTFPKERAAKILAQSTPTITETREDLAFSEAIAELFLLLDERIPHFSTG